MEPFFKTWELKDQEYDKDAYDKVMKAWDMGFIARKIIESADKPVFRVKASVNDPTKIYIIGRAARSGLGAVRNVVGPMTENQDSNQKRPDGKQFHARLEVPQPGKKFVQIMTHTKNEIPVMTVTRELLEDGSLKQTEECGGFTVTKMYVPSEHVENKDDEEL